MATSPCSMTGWVCDFQPQEAHPSSRRPTSRIKQVMSAFPVDRFALSSLIGKLQVLHPFRCTRTDCQTVQRLREEAPRDNPVVTSVGIVGNATAHFPSRMSDDIKIDHRGLEDSVSLAKSRTHNLSVSTSDLCWWDPHPTQFPRRIPS